MLLYHAILRRSHGFQQECVTGGANYHHSIYNLERLTSMHDYNQLVCSTPQCSWIQPYSASSDHLTHSQAPLIFQCMQGLIEADIGGERACNYVHVYRQCTWQNSNARPDILNIICGDTEYYGVAYDLQPFDHTTAPYSILTCGAALQHSIHLIVVSTIFILDLNFARSHTTCS